MEGNMIQADTIIDGKYKLLKPIGYGGMASIFLAEDINTKTKFAIKVMDKRLANDKKFIQRFEQEAKIGIMLNHVNIPKVYYYGNYDGYYYIVMEYIHGISLRQYLKKNGPMKFVIAVKIVLQVLTALNYAYQQGIKAHRDIKPDNIMIDSVSHQVKVMDFGIAKIENSTLTNATMMFTTNYATPEQLLPSRFKDGVDKRTDIYTTGIVLYELLTGKVPFEGESQIDIAQKQLKGEFIPIQSLMPEIPAGINEIIKKALHPLPQYRYQSPEEMSADLKSLKCMKPVSSTSMANAGKILPSKKDNKNWIAVVSVLVLFVVLLSGFLIFKFGARSKFVNIPVTTTPKSAKIFVDGQERSHLITPANVALQPGNHNITVIREGYKPAGQDIEIQKNMNKDLIQPIEFTLESVDPNQNSQDFGYVKVFSEPKQAKVFIDNVYIGETPLDKYKINTGDHTIYLTKKGYYDSDPGGFNIPSHDPGEEPWTAPLYFLLVKEPVTPPKPNQPPVPKPGSLSVKTIPPGALVYINDEMTDVTPLFIQKTAGKYTVKITKVGYKDHTEVVEIKDNHKTPLTILLTPDIDPPVLISPSNKSVLYNNDVRLTWKASSKAEYYRVFLTNAETGMKMLGDTGTKVTNTYFDIPKLHLSNGKSYFWLVTACKGESIQIPAISSWSFSMNLKANPTQPKGDITLRIFAFDKSKTATEALIYLDDIYQCNTPNTISVKRNTRYTIKLTKEGYQDNIMSVIYNDETPSLVVLNFDMKKK